MPSANDKGVLVLCCLLKGNRGDGLALHLCCSILHLVGYPCCSAILEQVHAAPERENTSEQRHAHVHF